LKNPFFARSGFDGSDSDAHARRTALADGGPLVAPFFTIPDVAGRQRQIRYAACLVTAPRVLRLLRDSGGEQQLTTFFTGNRP
jgi:hypothetical protein